MEPTSVQSKDKTRTGGRKGSLENPEILENVPGHVIPILEREFDDFDTRAAKFQRGELAEDEFVGFRLKQGVYGQRQPDVQMIRVKLPFGGVNPEQMEAFADLAEQYAPMHKGHVTTPNAKIAAYASQQLQVKNGVLIGIWDEAELGAIREKIGMKP